MSDDSNSPASARSPTPSDASNVPTPPRKARAASVRSDQSSATARSSPGHKGADADRDRDLVVDDDEDEDAGLFGEGSEDEDQYVALGTLDNAGQLTVYRPVSRRRVLDDGELDSGDDEGRRDRLDDDVDMQEERQLNTVDVSLGRHAVAKATDGEVSSSDFQGKTRLTW